MATLIARIAHAYTYTCPRPRCGARDMSYTEYRDHLAMAHNIVVRFARIRSLATMH